MPPATAAAYARTHRAKQSFAFRFGVIGAPPVVTLDTGAPPGTATVLTARAQYVWCSGFSLDVLRRVFATPANFGGTTHLVHGTMMVRRFPSSVLYMTIGGAGSVTIPLYFADARTRHMMEIAVAVTEALRQLTW